MSELGYGYVMHIAIAFDGVLHPYPYPYPPDLANPAPTDPPVAGAAAFVRDLIEAGHQVTITSYRAASLAGLRGMRRWLAEHAFPTGPDIDLTIASKVPAADLYVSDIAFRFEGDFDAVRRVVESGARTWVERQKRDT